MTVWRGPNLKPFPARAAGRGARSRPRKAASRGTPPTKKRDNHAANAACLLGARLDPTQRFRDFLRLRLKILGEHIEASSNSTGNQPQDQNEPKQCGHRRARSLNLSSSRKRGGIVAQIQREGGAPLPAAPMMNDSKGRCQHRKVMEPLAATRGAISRRSPAFQCLE